MRVGVVVNAFPLLSQTFVIREIIGLIEMGHDVRIIGIRNSREQLVHPDIERYDLLSRTRFIDAMMAEDPHAAWQGPTAWSELLAGVKHTVMNTVPQLRRVVGGPYPPSAALTRCLREALKDREIVHCQFGGCGVSTLPAAMELGLPLVVTFHGYDLRHCMHSGGRPFAELFAHSQCVIAISDHSREVLSRCGLPREKMLINPVGIDVASFEADRSDGRPSTGRPSTGCSILTVARFCREKRLDRALRIIRGLRDSMPDRQISYRIVGDGPLAASLLRLRDRLGLQKEVTFLGSLDAGGVRDELAAADIFLLTSQHEVTPVVLMEAQASALPVVTTDAGAISEVVDDGVSGYVVPYRDMEGMLQRLQHLVSNPQLWPVMGSAGQRIAGDRFDSQKLVVRLTALYENLIAGRSPAHGIAQNAMVQDEVRHEVLKRSQSTG